MSLKESPFLDKKIIIENESAFAIYDGFPISKGHSLIIPKRIVSSIFDLDDEEYNQIFLLLKNVRKIWQNPDKNNYLRSINILKII